MRKIWFYILSIAAMATWVACDQIDDDLSDCAVEFEVEYQLKLVTNLTTELETQLATVEDQEVRDAIRDYLKDIFTEYAHDIDLSFFATYTDSILLHHESHIMDANQRSYTLYLPVRDYMHLAMANTVNNTLVSPFGGDRCHTLTFNQQKRDTIGSHETGLFTARLPMKVLGNVSQRFNVNLYMANSSTALVVDSTGVTVNKVRAYATGFATDFQLADSAYVYAPKAPMVKSDLLGISRAARTVAFCNVNFPSRNPYNWWMKEEVASTRATNGVVIPEEEPEEGVPMWKYVVLVTLPNGSITRTDLTVIDPLLAGELKIIKGWLDDKGVVHTDDSRVGVSVMLDWNEGNEFEPDLNI